MASFAEEARERARQLKADFDKQKQQKEFERTKGLIGEQREQLFAAQPKQFEQATRSFGERLNLALGAQVGQARRGFVQSAARRGLTGSGVEQAGIQAVRAAGQQQFAQSLGEFQTKLGLAQAQERSQFRQAEFSFLASMAQLGARGDLEKELLSFQAQIAADQARSQQFGQILSLGVQVAAFAIGGPPGAAVAGAAINRVPENFTGPVGPLPGGI